MLLGIVKFWNDSNCLISTIQVYAIATYMNPESLEAIKGQEDTIDQALLDPSYHRTIRIVMYREVDMETCISAIFGSLAASNGRPRYGQIGGIQKTQST